MQISYHSVLTKIQKLQNLKKKKKKKNFFLYWPVRPIPAGIARNWPVRPVFFPVRNKGVERTGLLAGTVYSGRTSRYGTESITLFKRFLYEQIETTRQYSFQTSLSCMMFEIFFVYCWCIPCTVPEYLEIDGLCPFYAFSINIYFKKMGFYFRSQGQLCIQGLL